MVTFLSLSYFSYELALKFAALTLAAKLPCLFLMAHEHALK